MKIAIVDDGGTWEAWACMHGGQIEAPHKHTETFIICDAGSERDVREQAARELEKLAQEVRNP